MNAGTKGKSARYEMLTNVPVTVDIKYVDVWPDNGYGAQVSVKGTIDGETQTIYLKGKAWANLKALAEAGVISGYEKQHEEPTEKVNLPVVNGQGVVLTRRQLAGERFANLAVETQGAVSRTAGVPSVPGRASSVKQGVDIGGPIPGLDDDDMPPPVDEAYAAPETPQSPAAARLAAQFKLYDVCFTHALKAAAHAESMGKSVDISAIAATLYIAASR